MGPPSFSLKQPKVRCNFTFGEKSMFLILSADSQIEIQFVILLFFYVIKSFDRDNSYLK